MSAFNGDLSRNCPSSVYQGLRGIAAGMLRREPRHHTLCATELAHEVAGKFMRGGELVVGDRVQFFRVFKVATRNFLVSYARHRKSQKAGRGHGFVPLTESRDIPARAGDDEAVRIREALEEFARLDPRAAKVVDLRYFGALTFAEVADELGVCKRTVSQDWAVAKAWLRANLFDGPREA